MNTQSFMRWLLIVMSAIALIKGVWLLAWPSSASRAAQRWVAMPKWLLHVIGAVAFVFGFFCIGTAAAAARNYLIATTLVLGTIFIVVGIIYNSGDSLEKIVGPWISGKPTWMRVWGVVSVLVAAVLLWVLFV